MFEIIKKAIRKRELQKKRAEADRAMPFFIWHHFWRIGGPKEPWTGMGEVTYKDWHWFKQMIEDGTIFDYEVRRCHRACGHIIYKDVRYKMYDIDKYKAICKEHGWK